MRRKLYRDLGYASIHQYAELALGFKKSKTSQFLRLSESLKELPRLRRSMAAGELSWTKAREVAKVATPKTEAAWIREARKSPRRVLESRVAEARRRAREGHGLAKVQSVLDMGPPEGPGVSGGGCPAESDRGTKGSSSFSTNRGADVPMDIHVRMTSDQYAVPDPAGGLAKAAANRTPGRTAAGWTRTACAFRRRGSMWGREWLRPGT
jgi:hypothetical protein